MHFNTLYAGEPARAAEELEHAAADESELRAALINALRRIDELERETRELRALVTPLENR